MIMQCFFAFVFGFTLPFTLPCATGLFAGPFVRIPSWEPSIDSDTGGWFARCAEISVIGVDTEEGGLCGEALCWRPVALTKHDTGGGSK
jgi:hypothetical protein